jgi:NAD dependent epimerase/dehydratase family enzyme
MHVVVTGGTGLIGTALVPMLLDASHQVTVVSRSPESAARHFGGRVKACTINTLPDAFDGAINLAGATLDKRWTAHWKRVIRDSRVDYTTRIRQAAEKSGAKVLVSGSAINYYDEAGDTEITEATR